MKRKRAANGCRSSASATSASERLELIAFDLELRRVPRALIEAIWAGVDALWEASTAAPDHRLNRAATQASFF
jgi:hypothetical protein